MKRLGSIVFVLLLVASLAHAIGDQGGFGGGSSGGGGSGTVTSVTGTPPITSSGGAAPAIGLTTPLTGNAVTMGGDITGASNATTAVGSSNLQQPIMFIGSSAVKLISATTTTGTINTPIGVINGDLEFVHIALNNTTSSAFTPPAGWSATASCNSSGNTVQEQVFQHTASSEGATIAAFTWTTNGTGTAYATAFRNAAFDTCTASTGAAGTTFSTGTLTAAATTDRIIAIAAQPNGLFYNRATTANSPTGVTTDNWSTQSSGSISEYSYPITSTTVGAFAFTGLSNAWAGALIALSFSASSTATAPGALTYNESGTAFLAGLTLGNGINIGGTTSSAPRFSIIMPNQGGTASITRGGLGALDHLGQPINLISEDGSNTDIINIGDTNAQAGSASTEKIWGPTFFSSTVDVAGNFTSSTHSIGSTTGSHQATGPGQFISGATGASAIGTGGIFAATEGTAPTATTAVDELWADATSHLWKMNTNAGSQIFLVGAASLPGTAGMVLSSNTTGAGTFIATEAQLSAGSNTYGNIAPFTSGLPIYQAVATNAGHFTQLTSTNISLNAGSCSTAPTFNVFDGASNLGTAKIASATAQAKGTATTQAETLTFAAGDVIGIIVSTQGATCVAPVFNVVATVTYP